jgi:hypothetical protein
MSARRLRTAGIVTAVTTLALGIFATGTASAGSSSDPGPPSCSSTWEVAKETAKVHRESDDKVIYKLTKGQRFHVHEYDCYYLCARYHGHGEVPGKTQDGWASSEHFYECIPG